MLWEEAWEWVLAWVYSDEGTWAGPTDSSVRTLFIHHPCHRHGCGGSFLCPGVCHVSHLLGCTSTYCCHWLNPLLPLDLMKLMTPEVQHLRDKRYLEMWSYSSLDKINANKTVSETLYVKAKFIYTVVFELLLWKHDDSHKQRIKKEQVTLQEWHMLLKSYFFRVLLVVQKHQTNERFQYDQCLLQGHL